MNAKLSDVLKALNELNDNSESIVHNDDLTAVKTVLDEAGYVYLDRPTNHIYTKIEIRY